MNEWKSRLDHPDFDAPACQTGASSAKALSVAGRQEKTSPYADLGYAALEHASLHVNHVLEFFSVICIGVGYMPIVVTHFRQNATISKSDL